MSQPEPSSSPFGQLQTESSLLAEVLEETAKHKDELKEPWGAKTDKQVEQAVESVANVVTAARKAELDVEGMSVESIKQLVHDEKEQLRSVISGVLQAVLHDEGFRKIERTWSELAFLKSRLPGDGDHVQVQILNAGRQDLAKDMKKAGAAADSFTKSILYRNLYRGALGKSGETPNTLCISGISFGNTDNDLKLLSSLGKIAQAAHAPWISPAAPGFFDCESFLEFDLNKDWAKEFKMNRQEWNSFRAEPESRYVGLALPGVLLRKPYENERVSEYFSFTEQTTSGSDCLWGAAAQTLGVAVGSAYAEYGWPAKICGRYHGGGISKIPLVTKHDNPTKRTCVPVELDNQKELELSRLGFLPFERWANQDVVAFTIPASCYEPEEGNESDELSSRFPHLLVGCRFSHYLKVILRNAIGAQKSEQNIKKDLEEWLNRYKTDNIDPSESDKARYPLASFEVNVTKDGAGRYSAEIVLFPHHILEQIGVRIQLFGPGATEASE